MLAHRTQSADWWPCQRRSRVRGNGEEGYGFGGGDEILGKKHATAQCFARTYPGFAPLNLELTWLRKPPIIPVNMIQLESGIAHPERDTGKEPGLGSSLRAAAGEEPRPVEVDVSLVVGTAVVDAASAPFLAPLPAASPAPTLAATISAKARAPVDWSGAMTLDSIDNRSVWLGVLASPPRPLPPPPFATAAATAAAVATAFLRTSSCTEQLSAAATIPGEPELL